MPGARNSRLLDGGFRLRGRREARAGGRIRYAFQGFAATIEQKMYKLGIPC